jgi:hypothetical protein
MNLPAASFFDLNQECESITRLLHEDRRPEPLAASLAILGRPRAILNSPSGASDH